MSVNGPATPSEACGLYNKAGGFMEDSKKVPTQPKDSSSPVDRIIELTPELEVISATRGKIIDLTQVLFSPGAPVAKAAPSLPTPPKPIVARTASPFTAKISRQKGIESDVDAAFDFIQSKAEEIRGPRVEPKPSEDDLKVSAPRPIGDWDDTIVEEPLMVEEAEVTLEEKPAEDQPSPMAAEILEAAPVTEAKISSLEDLKLDDTLELTDVVHPVDLMPVAEISEASAPPDITPMAPAPTVLELQEEEPANLLEAAIEVDEAQDTIELTEIVSAEELSAVGYSSARPAAGEPRADAVEEEEQVIELIDIASAEELAAAGHTPPVPTAGRMQAVALEEEEEIIELSDIVSAEELAAADYKPPVPSEKEEVIELVDRVERPLPEETAAMASELLQNPPEALPELGPEPLTDLADEDTEEMTKEVFADAPATVKPETDQVIRLDSVLGHARKHQERLSEEITLGVEDALAKESLPDGAKFSIGMAMEEVKEALGPSVLPNEAEIEAVIEKVIRTKYGQSIEQMIAMVVEKVVTREMDNIKRNLMEDQGASDEL
jgi:hypothetical protein